MLLRMLWAEFGDDLIALGKDKLSDAWVKADKGKPVKTEQAGDPLPEILAYDDGEKFEAQMLEKLDGLAINAIHNEADVLFVFFELVKMAGEVRKFQEAQITKRAAIAAERDVAIARIEAQKELLLVYLDKTFDERKDAFQSFFRVIDDALEKDDMQELAMGLDSVIRLAQTSPFKDLRTIEETAAALGDKNHEWDF